MHSLFDLRLLAVPGAARSLVARFSPPKHILLSSRVALVAFVAVPLPLQAAVITIIAPRLLTCPLLLHFRTKLFGEKSDEMLRGTLARVWEHDEKVASTFGNVPDVLGIQRTIYPSSMATASEADEEAL